MPPLGCCYWPVLGGWRGLVNPGVGAGMRRSGNPLTPAGVCAIYPIRTKTVRLGLERVPGAMLRLSKLTDYAVVVLVRLSHADTVQTSPGIAASIGIPEPTVAKVLKTLAAGGLVTSQRGAHGGYRLLRQLAAIPIAEVIAAVDGPIALT